MAGSVSKASHGDGRASRKVADSSRKSVCENYDDLWLEKFEMLKQFKTKNRHVWVPTGLTVDEEDFRGLGAWVSRQRHLFHQNNLQPDRLEKLNSVGFIWTVAEKNKMTKKRGSVRGHSPAKNSKASKPTARRPKKLKTNQISDGFYEGKKAAQGQLSKPSDMMLDHYTWRRQLARVKQFHEKHRHYRVPRGYSNSEPGDSRDKADGDLGYWVETQRKNMRKGRMDSWRLNQLHSVGFWEGSDKTADENEESELSEWVVDGDDDDDGDHGTMELGSEPTDAVRLSKSIDEFLVHFRKVSLRKIIGTSVRKKYDVGGWYEGRVEAVAKNGKYRVLFTDKKTEDLTEMEVDVAAAAYQLHRNPPYRRSIPVGTRVQKKFDEGWYKGWVASAGRKRSTVRYDDGEEADMTDSELQVAAVAYRMHKSRRAKSVNPGQVTKSLETTKRSPSKNHPKQPITRDCDAGTAAFDEGATVLDDRSVIDLTNDDDEEPKDEAQRPPPDDRLVDTEKNVTNGVPEEIHSGDRFDDGELPTLDSLKTCAGSEPKMKADVDFHRRGGDVFDDVKLPAVIKLICKPDDGAGPVEPFKVQYDSLKLCNGSGVNDSSVVENEFEQSETATANAVQEFAPLFFKFCGIFDHLASKTEMYYWKGKFSEFIEDAKEARRKELSAMPEAPSPEQCDCQKDLHVTSEEEFIKMMQPANKSRKIQDLGESNLNEI